MTLADILSPEDVHLDVAAEKRADIFAYLADKVGARYPIDPRACAEALAARERLGSTGLGRGIAIPHAPLKGLTAPLAILLRLARPVDFSAPDEEPVDIVVMLLLPEQQQRGDQVKVLSLFARLLRDPEIVARLRAAPDAEAAIAALSEE